MRRPILLLLIFILLLVTPSAWRYFQFYRLSQPDREMPTAYDPLAVQLVATPASSDYVDEPQVGDGLILLDFAHNNDFTLEEIGSLDGRLAQRGFEIVPFTGGDLQTALRSVNAFVVITPISSFSQSEILAISDFVDRGGKLLMVGDPTRFEVFFEETEFSFEIVFQRDELPLNSIANEFDIIFNGDYLYNTIENEGNFRNIIVNEGSFEDTAVTDGLEQVVLYGAHSLEVGPSATSLFVGDENTWSSDTDRPGELTLAAISGNERVMALGDIHFLNQPYATVLDNGRFISQIADFLTNTQQRDFVLADFPYFFTQDIHLIYTGSPELGPDAFDEIIQLQDAFRQAGQTLSLAAEPTANSDTLYLGLYNQADAVAELLAEADLTIVIEPPLETDDEAEESEEEAESEEEEEAEEEAASEDDAAEDDAEDNAEDEEVEDELTRLLESTLGKVQLSGTSLILLHENGDDRSVVVLAASADGLETAVNRLLNLIPANSEDSLSDCLLQSHLALCPTGLSNEAVEPELLTGGTAEIDDEETDEEDDEEIIDEEPPTDEDGEEPTDDLNAVLQGPIGLGETVDGALADMESHSYLFSDGPATIDISVNGDSEMDAVLEIYDPENALIDLADSTFTEGTEELLNVEIPDDGEYTIIVRDFFNDGGGYSLTVTSSGEEAVTPIETETKVFLFVDDDGNPLGDGITSQAVLEEAFGAFETTVWVSSTDGPLSLDVLEDHTFLVWDTGDYEDPDGFFGPDTEVIFEFLDEGGGLLLTGSMPGLFSGSPTADLSELAVSDTDDPLLAGFDGGEIFSLTATVPATLSEIFAEDFLEDEGVGLLEWPAGSEGDGSLIAFAGEDPTLDQKSMIILFPIALLPDEPRTTLLENAIAWFGLN
ncbi:MAG: hypothetical protein AAF490_06840 [Chloroflexota bacterium]